MKRIQRQRTKGWRMPEGAIYVGRPTMWGNPYRGSAYIGAAEAVSSYRFWIANKMAADQRYRDALSFLRGRDLVCWCPLWAPCHADVLLELANR